MLFNSLSFAIFFPIVFLIYWFVTGKSTKWQNILLLIASYYFYACWDWRFLFLLMFSTFLDYFTGLKISNANSIWSSKFWLWLSIIVNVGFLAVFKYYNFFILSFTEALSNFGFKINPFTINVILPVGISFYTFHGLSYIIDIYKKRIKAETNFIDYSVFVSFFPLLVAGPIERATHLLPQIKSARKFTYERAADGMRQILGGLFKKIVIADLCAEYANIIFENPGEHTASTLLLGAIFFAFQIYGDFSGYSDIALGTARLLGFDLLRNFAYPYFSRDIAEFWRRWHISLSTWFRDYLYIPLGGSRVTTFIKVRNTFIIFLVSGFWHGANWTFIVWGLLNALYILPSIVFNTNRINLDIVATGKYLPSFSELFKIVLTFLLTTLAWIFFRSETVGQAIHYLTSIFDSSLISIPRIAEDQPIMIFVPLCLAFIMLIAEWIGREGPFMLYSMHKIRIRGIRWIIYLTITTAIYLSQGKAQAFIYFQF